MYDRKSFYKIISIKPIQYHKLSTEYNPVRKISKCLFSVEFISVRVEGNIGKCTGVWKIWRRYEDGRNMRTCHYSQFSQFHIIHYKSYKRR